MKFKNHKVDQVDEETPVVVRKHFPESWIFDSIDHEYVFFCRQLLFVCFKSFWVSLHYSSYLILFAFKWSKINFLIEEGVGYSYPEEFEIADRIGFDDYSDLFIPSVDSIDQSPREIKNDKIIKIRNDFPESWIFDSINNVSLG